MRFIFCFLMSLMVVMASTHAFAELSKLTGARFALVIGNSRYPDSDTPLKTAVNDAREFAKELKRNGFDVEIGENLSKVQMRSAFDRLYAKINVGSVALIFFSGYGIQSNRQSYLIPVDGQIWTEADVRRDGFSVDTTLAEMNARGASVKIAILDASRRNPFERRFRQVAAGLAPVIAPRDTMIVYSAAPGTVINDSATERSLFVLELVKQMGSPGLTSGDVFSRTSINVARASNGEQTPWFSSSLAEEFSFNQDTRRDSKLSGTTTSAPEKKPQTKPEASPSDDSEADARRDYQRAGQLGTKQAWQDFLDKHPTGHYANLAETQIAKLESKIVSPKSSEPPAAKEAPEKKPAEDKAIRELDRQIQDNPKDANSYYKRGIFYAKNGEFSRALKDFNEAIRINPNDADALNNRCWARAILDELQMALEDCDEALRIRPQFANALDSRGLVKLKIGLPSNAIVDYEASLRINAKQASSLYGRGIAKLRSGNAADGNSDIAAAKSINPKIAEEFARYGIR